MTWPGRFPIVRANMGAAPVFPPDVILGASLWKWHRLLSGDPALTLAGSSVVNWPCKAANGDFIQITSSQQPAFSATSFNGNAGITGDGSNDRMIATASSAITAGSRPYMWIVGQRVSGVAAFQTLAGIYNGANHHLFTYSSNTNVWQFERRTTGDNVFTNFGAADNNRHLFETGFTTGGVASHVIDGVSVASTATLALAAGINHTVIFATETSSFPGNFTIAEVVISRDEPTEQQKTDMRNYFASIPQYGLSIAI